VVTSAHDLLAAEIEIGYVRDERGRLLHDNVPSGPPAPLVVVGFPAAGEPIVVCGAQLEDVVANKVRRIVAEDRRGAADRIVRTLGAGVRAETGPVWVVPADLPLIDLDPDARVVWHEEFGSQLPQEVVDDLEAPWAAVVVGGRVVSSCDTVRRGPSGFEAGVRTATEHRARGYAAAATAEWGRRMQALGRPLFYATNDDNRSSQRVAQRLGLVPIGRLMTFRLSFGDAPR
jgi:RimJ/RimL family protein N-acetyltransferase